jgi:formyltetrahydrofolate synthetase
VGLVEAGCSNLERHIKNTRLYGVPVVVGVNAFASDTQAELEVGLFGVFWSLHDLP